MRNETDPEANQMKMQNGSEANATEWTHTFIGLNHCIAGKKACSIG